jgi:polysaccharide biosynthesis/export protein
MNTFILLRLLFVIITYVGLSACSTTGDVVRVTNVKSTQLNGLTDSDLAKIEEIKKARENYQGFDKSLTNVTEATSSFSVFEYLMKYPEIKGSISEYRVGAEDVLSVMVYEENDLSRDAVRVSGDGYISFPLIGRVMISKLTTSEIEELIKLKLAENQYLLDAHVSIMVKEYNSQRFLVLGSVNSPGSYCLRAKEHVLDAISRAAGVNLEQASKRAMIIRTLDVETENERKIVINIDLNSLLTKGDQISNLCLMDKDVLYIPTAEHIYIIGQVQSPGSYTMPEGEITLVGAIGMAGGFTRIAARNRTRIIRLENGVEKIIEVKVDAITKAGKKIQDVPIKPGDVIVVPESFF